MISWDMWMGRIFSCTVSRTHSAALIHKRLSGWHCKNSRTPTPLPPKNGTQGFIFAAICSIATSYINRLGLCRGMSRKVVGVTTGQTTPVAHLATVQLKLNVASTCQAGQTIKSTPSAGKSISRQVRTQTRYGLASNLLWEPSTLAASHGLREGPTVILWFGKHSKSVGVSGQIRTFPCQIRRDFYHIQDTIKGPKIVWMILMGNVSCRLFHNLEP